MKSNDNDLEVSMTVQRKSFEQKVAHYNRQIDEIASRIVEQMKKGAGRWEMPWHKGIPIATNAFTGRQYGGNNLIILWNVCLIHNYKHNQWATLKQWTKLKARVNKGEKGTLVCIAVPRQRKTKKTSQLKLYEPIESTEITKENVWYRFKFIHVFNEAQVSGYFGNQPDLFKPSWAAEDVISQIIEKCGAVINTGGERAYYSITHDHIQMPERARFISTRTASSQENYYATLLHELIHWTGHSGRCARQLIGQFGSKPYAFEELVAELGSALLCSQLNQRIHPRADHAQYLSSWLKVLESDFSYFTEALELARSAIFFLNKLTGVNPFLKDQHIRKLNNDRVRAWEDYCN